MSSSNQRRKANAKLAERLAPKTHFSQTEIEKLLQMLHEMSPDSGKLDRIAFHDFLHNTFGMTDDTLLDKIFGAFDKEKRSFINQEEWVSGLSLFLRGTFEERSNYCFDLYDLNGDGTISREEIFHMLKNCMVKQVLSEEDPDESSKELVELILQQMDIDRDNKLSRSDFFTAVTREPLLLEAFGPCLPSEEKVEEFLKKLEEITLD